MNLQALEGLGKDYQIIEVAIKPHATSARVLSAIEAANTLCLETIKQLQKYTNGAGLL